MIMNPQININGTGREAMVNDRRAILDALEATMKAMQEIKPHGRDYVGKIYQWEVDRALYNDRFNVLDKLRNDIMDEALDIQEKA